MSLFSNEKIVSLKMKFLSYKTILNEKLFKQRKNTFYEDFHFQIQS